MYEHLSNQRINGMSIGMSIESKIMPSGVTQTGRSWKIDNVGTYILIKKNISA